MNRGRRLLMGALAIILLASCTGRETPTADIRQPTVAPTATTQPTEKAAESATVSPVNTATSIPTNIPTKSASASPEVTQISPYVSYYHLLPPGQYLIYKAPSSLGAKFNVISLDGSFERTFVDGIESQLVTFTRDGKRMAVLSGETMETSQLIVYDLVENTNWSFEAEDCYESSFSPGGTKVAVGCPRADYGWGINIFSLEDQTITLLTNWLDLHINGGRPSWSPNGEWVAYLRFLLPSDNPDKNGFYITRTSCLNNPGTCEEQTEGPFLSGETLYSQDTFITWSPDSRFLAVNKGVNVNNVQIVDIQTGEERTLISPNDFGAVVSIAWSPDGQWLAFGKGTGDSEGGWIDIYLISPWTGGTILLKQQGGIVYGWFTVPQPFAPGDTYAITEAGANLNLRASPSLDAAILAKLQPGDTITILEGPVQADGYEWWKMRTTDGVEGWAANIPEWYEKQ